MTMKSNYFSPSLTFTFFISSFFLRLSLYFFVLSLCLPYLLLLPCSFKFLCRARPAAAILRSDLQQTSFRNTELPVKLLT